MSLTINYLPTIDIYELEKLFKDTYGYRIHDIRGVLFGDSFTNDCYKKLHLSWAEEEYERNDGNIYWDEVFNDIRLANVVTHEYDNDYDNEAINFAKIVKLLRDQGITEDEVLIDVS